MFNSDWTEKDLFMYLKCSEPMVKSGNMKRYYETKHNHFELSYL